MEEKKIIAYAITHAPRGVKGGPYEADDDEGRWGTQSTSLRPGHAVRWKTMPAKERRREILRAVRKVRPHARVIRIVRAERPAPSEAQAVAVLRELVAERVDCAAYERIDTLDPILARARRVLAGAGPDPMPVVRAAMRESASRAAAFAALSASSAEADATRAHDLYEEARANTRAAVDAYRKAGGE